MTLRAVLQSGYVLLMLMFAIPVIHAQLTLPREEATNRIIRLINILSVLSVAYLLLTTFILAALND